MKNCYLFVLLCFIASATFAQNVERLNVRDIAQHPELLTPDVAQVLLEHGSDGQGFLPPVSILGYNLLDSAYFYDAVDGLDEWELSSKDYYTNDCSIGKFLTRTIHNKNTMTGVFKIQGREERLYYPNGGSMTTNYYQRDNIAQEWVLSNVTQFNQNGTLDERWTKFYNETDGVFFNGTRTDWEYDSNDSLKMQAEFDYDVAADAWLPTTRVVYLYNNGVREVETNEVYVGLPNNWQPLNRRTYSYDAQGKRTGWLRENYGAGIWSPTTRSTYTYNGQGLLSGQLVEGYLNSAWLTSSKWEATYYASGQLQTRKNYVWHSVQQDWIPIGSDSLNEQGYFVELIILGQYHDNPGGYDFGLRINTTLNADFTTSKVIADKLEYLTFDQWAKFDSVAHHQDAFGKTEDIISHSWDTDLNEYYFRTWQHYYNTGCFFSEVHQPESGMAACSFANPMQVGQPIGCPMLDATKDYQLDLFSLTGTRVHSQSFQSGQPLTAEGLGTGLYVMAIRDGQGVVYRSKVVVGE